MNNDKFCHLHLHNELSYLDGMGTSKQYVKRAKELGFTHLALTNHGNIDGLIQFQKICDEQGIKPIMGCEMYIVPKIMEKNKGEQRGHITILIKDERGWESLCSMLSKANLLGFYYKPRIDFDRLLSSSLSGLVILTGCSKSFLHNELGEAFLWNLTEQTKNVYIEIMPHIFDDDTAKEYNISHSSKFHNKRLLELSMKYGLKLCATNDIHYVNKDDCETQEVLLAIQTKAKWDDSKRWKFSEKGLYLRTANEMLIAFKKQGDFDRDTIWKAMRNTMKIAETCESFRIPKHNISLPKVKKPKTHRGISDDYYLRQVCIDRLTKKKRGLSRKKYTIYQKRLQYELRVISDKKFVRYFLIVRDLIRWCKKKNILTGPGRGSVGGSLAAYLLEITTIDPIKYSLLFSRFINKNRCDYPDIDMDFEDSKRGLIKEYLEKKYGKDNIVGVSTFLTMKGKAVIRDVARVFDVPLSDVGQFTKSFKINDELESSLKDGLSQFEGQQFQKKYPEVVKHALKLEGQIRGNGSHAAAIVVSPVPLIDSNRGNLCIRGTENKSTVINWEMNDIDYVGLMKLDILGLNTLSILNEMKETIPCKLSFGKLKSNDEKVFKELSEGRTVGIFQFSTPLLTEMSKKMRISNFDEMVAALALIRPGPLESGMADDYLKRKLSGVWEKKHPLYEKITKDTYGVVIYQEQVMQVINKVAGLSYSIADEIRKVIGKKRHSREFEPYRKRFIEGCLKQKTFSKQEAKWFWEMILKCARYLFNKSHAVEYAMLAYWTLWSKIYYPNEFITACLSYGGEKKKSEYVKEAQKLGLTISLPKVGISDAFKWKIKSNVIYIPFIEIKGVGEKTALECCRGKEKIGFFTLQPQMKGKIGKILNEIGSYDINSNPKDVGKYFSFGIDCGISIKEQSFQGFKEKLSDCKKCDLRKECRKPVMPSIGKHNIVILGESPVQIEDLRGIPFIGRAGGLLINELKKYGLRRNLFHVTNVCKCYPAETKIPQKEHVSMCLEWLRSELEQLQCRLVLSLGATGLYALTGKEGGIMSLSGKMEYNDKLKCNIFYCIHPAAVLRDPNKQEMFSSAIKSFAKIVKENIK